MLSHGLCRRIDQDLENRLTFGPNYRKQAGKPKRSIPGLSRLFSVTIDVLTFGIGFGNLTHVWRNRAWFFNAGWWLPGRFFAVVFVLLSQMLCRVLGAPPVFHRCLSLARQQ